MSPSGGIQLISVLGIFLNYVGFGTGANGRINKLNSQKDEEQKQSGNFFFLES